MDIIIRDSNGLCHYCGKPDHSDGDYCPQEDKD